MSRRSVAGMRRYWDEAARCNAPWYVDTSLDPHDPDMERFLATGREIADLIDRSPVPLPGRSLAVDVGCGLGRVCLALAERFDRVIGVDISTEMLERARGLVGEAPVEFMLGDGATLQPLPDACADVVTSFTVLQHIPDLAVIESYLREAARVLRSGGLLAVQWNGQDGARRWRLRRAWLHLLHRTRLRAEPYGRHAPEFLGTRVSEARMRGLLDEFGFRIEALEGAGTLYSFVWATRQ